jgi:hypothetical protein
MKAAEIEYGSLGDPATSHTRRFGQNSSGVAVVNAAVGRAHI